MLNWVNKTAVDEDKRQPTPGAKKQSTSPMKFLGFLQDGTVLANLANKLQPGKIFFFNRSLAAYFPTFRNSIICSVKVDSADFY